MRTAHHESFEDRGGRDSARDDRTIMIETRRHALDDRVRGLYVALPRHGIVAAQQMLSIHERHGLVVATIRYSHFQTTHYNRSAKPIRDAVAWMCTRTCAGNLSAGCIIHCNFIALGNVDRAGHGIPRNVEGDRNALR